MAAQTSLRLVIGAGVALPLLVIIVLVGGSLKLGASLAADPPANALVIEVIGWRWWWEIRYPDSQADSDIVTANEIHIPVGRPIEIRLTSGDVIHSFWVPDLQGKTDAIPGQTNRSWFQADIAGVYRGQCAEFCGQQHALMGFLVVAQPEPEFRAWLQRQQQLANTLATELAQRGSQVFLESGCAGCHQIRGTDARGTLGPDLTHIGSRQTLAAVTRPNNIGHLGGWISDPDAIKPGSLMPAIPLSAPDIRALLAYLQELE